jgi:[ribosomal protein S5]-alanine N-acetyltransferase
MKLEFKHLTQINPDDIIVLNNPPEVLRQIPPGSPNLDHEKCLKWVTQKEAQWAQYGYGPWAFVINNKFAGWGGLQFEEGEADLALVLHPDYWGTGKIIYDEIVRRAFTEMHFEAIKPHIYMNMAAQTYTNTPENFDIEGRLDSEFPAA